MTASSKPSDESKIRRLERRLDRERRARREAEEIAERGMRSLYDANHVLDQRINERTQELQEALAQAERAIDAKSGFLAQMSHQINTPLNGLMGLLELLATEIRDPQSQEWHDAAHRSAERLQRIASRLTIYASLEGADLRAGAPVKPLAAVLGEAYDRWHAACLRVGQLLSVDLLAESEVRLHAPLELDLLLDELLSNATLHANPGAVVLAGWYDADSNDAIIEVTDAGPGINPDQLAGIHSLSAGPDQVRERDKEINLGFELIDRVVRGLGGGWEVSPEGQPTVRLRLPCV